MISSSYPVICSSCCDGCSLTPQAPGASSSQSPPFSLANLLPLGTLQFNIISTEYHCDHAHAEDGWHDFRPFDLIRKLRKPDFNDALGSALNFLVDNEFIRGTCRLHSPGVLLVRIYIIPFDLPGVQGRLTMRARPKDVPLHARQFLRVVFSNIVQDPSSWAGYHTSDHPPLFPSPCSDSRTLAEIYGDLPSPLPRITPGQEISARLLDPSDDLRGLGMRSSLYAYQRRSVAAMIQTELDPQNVPDPLYIPLVGMNQSKFYLQPGTMEILREQPIVAPCRGGILCEELGTGKTVITLSLILATLKQLPSPEPSVVDSRPVMTALSFRHFPSPDLEFDKARNRFYRGKNKSHLHSYKPVPSLRELLLHRMCTTPDTAISNTSTPDGLHRDGMRQRLTETFDLTSYWEICKANVPFYYHFDGEPKNNERTTGRNAIKQVPRVMYLTAATLVIVPPNLLSQWDREIKKHCEYPLRVFMVRSDTVLPPAKDLAADYDIILMTYSKLAHETTLEGVSKLHSWEFCKCPEFPSVRVPDCRCKPPSNVSPLLQIRWKRLVIDEGHVSASQSTATVVFAKSLSIERRWIVTGTPTTNLMGLSLGKKTNEEAEKEESDADSEEEEEDIFDQDSKPLGATLAKPSQSEPSSSRSTPLPDTPRSRTGRVWTKYDREDIRKLMDMIMKFVGMPHSSTEPNYVQTHIKEPLFDPAGPQPGAIQVLNQIMSMVMIRHRINDVEVDVALPPVRHESILLDLDPLVVKSYNALQAAIAINAVDSERKDQDYMFHAKNTNSLQLTVKNMSQLMFWSVDDGLHNVDELLRVSQDHVETATKRGAPAKDIDLLHQAFKHVRLAAEDATWRAVQYHEDVPHKIFDMDPLLFRSWSRIVSNDPNPNPSFSGFMHNDRLIRLRRFVTKHPLKGLDHLIPLGAEVAEKDRLDRQAYMQSMMKKKDYQKDERKSGRYIDDSSGTQKARNAAAKAAAQETVSEMQKELTKSLARLESFENEESGLPSKTLNSYGTSSEPTSELLAQSILAPVRLGSSASTKLNYILNDVIQYAPSEKFLIFSDSELTLAHVAEALELVQIKFLRFSTQIKPQIREQTVLTFETSDVYRVFLMELKHGARGLNLISASRIIFCEPVWQADVESQAIKRAHRIGQTKTISVKTLAIRDTAEQNMVTRRNALKDSTDKLPKLIEEAGMRHFIANPKFIEHPSTLKSTLDIPLLKLPPKSSLMPRQPLSPSKHTLIQIDGSTQSPSQADGGERPSKLSPVKLPTIRLSLPKWSPTMPRRDLVEVTHSPSMARTGPMLEPSNAVPRLPTIPLPHIKRPRNEDSPVNHNPLSTLEEPPAKKRAVRFLDTS